LSLHYEHEQVPQLPALAPRWPCANLSDRIGFAHCLAEKDATIAVLDIIPPDAALDRMKTDYGVKTECYKTDVTRRDEVNQVIERIEKDSGGVDI